MESTATVSQLVVALSAVEAAAPPRPVVLDSFDRQIDTSVVNIRCPAAVVLDETAVLPSQVELTGAPLSKSFVLRFLGSSNLASSRASKFMHLQRVGGAWQMLSASDADGPPPRHRLFVDTDKSQ